MTETKPAEDKAKKAENKAKKKKGPFIWDRCDNLQIMQNIDNLNERLNALEK